MRSRRIRTLLVPPVGAPKETGRLKREKRDAEWAKWNEQQDRAGGYGARIGEVRRRIR